MISILYLALNTVVIFNAYFYTTIFHQLQSPKGSFFTISLRLSLLLPI